MRKIITLLVAATVLFSAFAFAEDLSVLTDGELVSLHQDVLDEMERRYIPAALETDSELADITERVISFFVAWSRNDPDGMLALCDAGWKATVKDPRTALIGLTDGRTPLDATVERVQEIAGEGPDGLTYELVTLTSHLDKNDGLYAGLYRVQFLVRKEEDGFWYVNPSGLGDCEAVEEEFPEEGPVEPEGDTGAASGDTLLYYQPDGGEYYHLDQNCLSVHTKYLPLQGSFRYAELNDEPYRDLKPCQVCGAPVRADGASLSEAPVLVGSSDNSRLVGLLVTREDLAAYVDESGVVLASCTQDGPDAETEYRFGDISGLRLICFIVPEEGRIVSDVDEGISSVDFMTSEDGGSVSMDAAISVVPGQDEELFFYSPVLLAESGQVFAVPGDFMAVSAAMNPPGSSVGQAVRDERKHMENGMEITDTTTVNIRIEAVREPLKIRLLQFSETHELLKSEEFEPGAVPEQIALPAEADYLLLETVEKGPDGGSFIRREVIGRDADSLNTMSCREDGICLCHYHEVVWETAVPGEGSASLSPAGN